jgi:hypothetical protein
MRSSNDPRSLACTLTSDSGDNSKRSELQSLKLLIPDEVADFHAKSVGYDLQRLDRHVALATLDLAHVCAIQAGSVAENILRPLAFKPKRSNGLPNPLLNILHRNAVSSYSG